MCNGGAWGFKVRCVAIANNKTSTCEDSPPTSSATFPTNLCYHEFHRQLWHCTCVNRRVATARHVGVWPTHYLETNVQASKGG